MTQPVPSSDHMIHLCAPNDVNGNPQRAWVQFNKLGGVVAFHDEGHSGCDAVPKELVFMQLAAPRINVSFSEWNSWREAAEANTALSEE